MQVDGTLQGASAVPRHGRLKVLTIVALVVTVMSVVMVGILLTRGGTQEAFLEPAESWVTFYDEEDNAHQARVR